MKKVLIWAEHAFQLYSVKPVAEKYIRQGCDVHLMTEFSNNVLAANYLGIPLINIHQVKDHRRRWQSRLVKLFEAAFVGMDYSMVYASHQRGEAGLKKFLREIRWLKFRKENVNRYFNKLTKILTWLGYRGIKERYDLLISYTKVYNVLLLPSSTRHISIMESWDHPIKLPYFTQPDYCLVWNSDLADDTRRVQYLHRLGQIEPLKFRYIKERKGKSNNELIDTLINKEYREEIIRLQQRKNNGKVILYPTTTSSAGIEHEGEMRVIEDICKALKGTSHTLYIKPKPNGPKGDYDRFSAYTNILVGTYSTNSDSRDMLDEDYHTFRYLILKSSDIVLNVGTTFVLEAALLRLPIIQLNLSEQVYGGFAHFTKTYHLQKYILSLPKCTHFDGNANVLLLAVDKVELELSKAMEKWITKWTV